MKQALDIRHTMLMVRDGAPILFLTVLPAAIGVFSRRRVPAPAEA